MSWLRTMERTILRLLYIESNFFRIVGNWYLNENICSSTNETIIISCFMLIFSMIHSWSKQILTDISIYDLLRIIPSITRNNDRSLLFNEMYQHIFNKFTETIHFEQNMKLMKILIRWNTRKLFCINLVFYHMYTSMSLIVWNELNREWTFIKVSFEECVLSISLCIINFVVYKKYVYNLHV